MSPAPFASRPQTFDRIEGQEHAVGMLRNLLRPQPRGLNILFHGAIGSGKTSLAHIYAKGLNCSKLQADSSPCLECDHCRDNYRPGLGLKEFDVPGLKARGQDVVGQVGSLASLPAKGGFRILFLDEAHALSDGEADALLKIVEEEKPNVVFLFATTELHNIRRALRSRLFLIEVRPLSRAVSLGFLREIASRLEMECDPDALKLLAGLKDGYPRDLVKGMEQLKILGGPVSAERVRELFGVNHVPILLDYFTALAEADEAGQLRFLNDWHESVHDKLRWVQAVLTTVYYRDIRHMALVGDPVIDSIPAVALKRILALLKERLAVDDAEMSRRWLGMLRFWSPPSREQDCTNLLAQFVVFHEFVNGGLVEREPTAASAPRLQRAMPHPALQADDSSTGFLPRTPLPQSVLDRRPASEHREPGFLTEDDVRTVVNTASFFAQHHGKLFNAAFTLRPAFFDSNNEHEPEHRKIAAEFLAELERVAVHGHDVLFARLCVFGRDAEGFYCRGVIHVSERGEDDAALRLRNLQDWARSWRQNDRLRWHENALLFRTAADAHTSKAAWSFHWQNTLALLEGLGREVLDWDKAEGAWKPLRGLLGMRSQRPKARRTVTTPLVQASSLLAAKAMARACANRMEALSAFDDRKWSWVRRGWELHEHRDRCETIKERAADIDDIAAEYAGNGQAAALASAELKAGWPTDPKQRPRRHFKGWWHIGSSD